MSCMCTVLSCPGWLGDLSRCWSLLAIDLPAIQGKCTTRVLHMFTQADLLIVLKLPWMAGRSIAMLVSSKGDLSPFEETSIAIDLPAIQGKCTTRVLHMFTQADLLIVNVNHDHSYIDYVCAMCLWEHVEMFVIMSGAAIWVYATNYLTERE